MATAVATRRRPDVLRVVVGVAVAAAAIALPFNFNPSTNAVFSEALYLAVAAAGLNLLTGYNGQISIGHAAFFGVGAFTSALLVVDHGWSIEATIPVAAVLAAVLGIVVGFPALRVRGLYLALITLGLAVLFQPLASKFIKSGFGVALYNVPRGQRSSLVSGLAADQYQYYVCLALAALGLLLSRNLIRSRVGRAMIATRDREIAAATSGVNLAWAKVGTFAVSAAYAGVAGSLSVLVTGIADGTNPLVYFQDSIEFLVAVVIGGSATLTGPFVGAFVLVAIKRNTQSLIEGKRDPGPGRPGRLPDRHRLRPSRRHRRRHPQAGGAPSAVTGRARHPTATVAGRCARPRPTDAGGRADRRSQRHLTS